MLKEIDEKMRQSLECLRAGNFEEARHLCSELLKKQPDNADLLNLFGIIHYHIGDYQAALRCMQRVLRVYPDNADVYYHLGLILRAQGDLTAAINAYRRALKINPHFPEAHVNLGYALQAAGEVDAAITCYRKAIELNPNFTPAYNNIGLIFQEQRRLDEAIIYYQKAIDLNPGFADAHWKMSLALLLSGNLKQGWEEYEWRWKTKKFLAENPVRQPAQFSQSAWDGSSLEGKSIFIYSEQGIGDEIMFASCFQEVIDQVDKCIVECDKRLIPIFTRSFPGALFIERGKETDLSASKLPQTDMVIPSGSLPKFLRIDLSSFPGKRYLVPEAEKVKVWRDRFRELGDGMKVGISWRGGANPEVRQKRSIALKQWATLLSLSGIHFMNLQYGDYKGELREVQENYGVTIHDWEDADPLKDLDNFAAEIAALDLVLSVDNSTVHMAGAMGTPVWVLLPLVPDWRWMLGREDSPWYPTMRLFRQQSPGDWESVIKRIAGELGAITLGKKL